MLNSKKSLALASAAGLALILGTGAIAISESGAPSESAGKVSASSPSVSPAARKAVRQISRTPRVLRKEFALFARQRRQTDALPPRIARSVSRLSAIHGTNPKLSRGISPADDVNLWVTPGRGQLCMTLSLPKRLTTGGSLGTGGTCKPLHDVRASGIHVATYCTDRSSPATVLVFGVAPDSVADVQLLSGAAVASVARLREGAYVLAAERPTALSVGGTTKNLANAPKRC